MKWRVVKIFPLCALILVMASPSVQADIGLCNRFLTFAAKVAGDSTAEMKRRIAYLLETGKIGEEHLARMQASVTPASPFKSGQHLSSDIVPHASAILRLVTDETLNWSEVRRFVGELQKDLKRSREKRNVHEKETEAVFYPIVIETRNVTAESESRSLTFKEGGVEYVVERDDERSLNVIEKATGEVVSTPIRYALQSPPAVFEHKGSHYFVAEVDKYQLTGQRGSVACVISAFGGVVQRADTAELGTHMTPAVFKQDGVPYVVHRANTPNSRLGSELRVMEALTGRVVKTIKEDHDVTTLPTVIEENGVAYLLFGGRSDYVMGAGDGAVYFVEALTGKAEWRLPIEHPLDARPVIVEKDGVRLIAFHESGNGHGMKIGHIYLVKWLTGEVVGKLTVYDEFLMDSPEVIEEDGRIYLDVRSGDDTKIYRIQIYGPLSNGGENR